MRQLLLIFAVVMGQSVLAADKKPLTKEGSALPLPAEPKHGRPYLMPETERQRIRGLIAREGWAKQDYEQLKKKAAGGDGYSAAFLFALERDAKYVPTATKWLLGKLSPHGVKRFKDRLDDPKFFAGGRPWMGVIFYKIQAEQIIAFDWVYDGQFAKVYINGKMEATASTNNEKIHVNSNPVTIGTDGYGLGSTGEMDDIRIYNRALSAEEVKALYDLEKPKK